MVRKMPNLAPVGVIIATIFKSLSAPLCFDLYLYSHSHRFHLLRAVFSSLLWAPVFFYWFLLRCKQNAFLPSPLTLTGCLQ